MNRSGELLHVHHQLDRACRDRGSRVFVSDWYCQHPFADEILALMPGNVISPAEVLPYYFQNDAHNVHREIQSFHRKKGEWIPSVDQIFVTAGLSPLVTAQILMLKRLGIQRVYYVRPLYYTYYFLAETLGIELVPVNEEPALGSDAILSLPSENCQWLIICDPVWYLGRNVSPAVVEQIMRWQSESGGMVMVDGAFQYQRWSGNWRPEITSTLLPDQTLRNLCPTKSAAMHGIRFSYAIVPVGLREELRYCYANTSGSGSVLDRNAALAVMRWLNTAGSNAGLLEFIHGRYRALTQHHMIDDPIGASASYFAFVSLPVPREHLIVMDQQFFDATCYPGLVRFNLLLPDSDLAKYILLAARILGRDGSEVLASLATSGSLPRF